MCTSLRIRIRERLEKYFLLSVWRRKLYGQGPRLFIIWNIPICNSGQYIYVTGLCNFFFVPQDLIDIINSYFQRIDFQRNFLLFGFYHSTSQFFSDENNQPSMEWLCVYKACKAETMAESCRWASNVTISILLKNRWFSYVRVFLKRDEYPLYNPFD